MIWSKTKPTKAGWWWWKPTPDMAYKYGGMQVAEVTIQTKGLWLEGFGYLEYFDGEWSSEPVQEPKEA